MLVLSRRSGERVIIGDNIEVTIVDVRRDRVTLGFTAPNDIPIHREEIRKRIESGNPQPLMSGPSLALEAECDPLTGNSC
jgi:carbon storage regulator